MFAPLKNRGKHLIILAFFWLLAFQLHAQVAQVRGFVFDSEDGSPIMFGTVQLAGTKYAALTDETGFYSITNVTPGTYTLLVKFVGYDSAGVSVTLSADDVKSKNLYVSTKSKALKEVRINAEQTRKEKEVYISQTSIKPKQLQRIPSVGGEPDLVQYLQILPGVVFSGDQGGQLYIRGGSPVMNRVMLDGLTIYNPFHSIGLFSVFDSDILKSADVYSAGFGAEYGGRISAIVDVKTRDGNKTRQSGKINTSPFNSKLLLEGPIKKYVPGETHSSYILSYKNSYLNQVAPIIYPYVNNGELPYSFSDLYGKYSLNTASGSYLNLFGFNYNDKVAFENTTAYDWKANGAGMKFLLVPEGSRTVVNGSVNYSDYYIEQIEEDNKPRKSGMVGYDAKLDFTYFLFDSDKMKYGLEMVAFRTDFEIFNSLDRRITQFQNTTEINGYINYLKNINKKLLLEGGLRIQRYASLQENSLEPRLRAKYNINKRWRLKASAGRYSQNLMSAVSDRDVVNLFYGFLSGPENLPDEFRGEEVTSRLQKSRHGVFGVEYDVNSRSSINAETYIKDFTQITNINRDKIFDNTVANSARPSYLKEDYVVEDGAAYGFDVTYKYEDKQWYLYGVYSYNVVNRFDGIRTYQPHFDRRHNINLVGSYDFGKQKEKEWSANLRWNFGSGFPFTLTQGFYEVLDFGDGANTDYTTTNGDLGILYGELNQGRLPYYHRLDASLKRIIKWDDKKDIGKNRKVEVILSITNVYNRPNIFYFDRVEYERVDQLPILPSLSASYSF